jgi:hypothetical protein
MTTKRQVEQALHLRVQSSAGRTVENIALLVTGSVLGATAMYVFDERSGRRRRALARDKANHVLSMLRWTSARRTQDLKNRAVGRVQELRSRVRDAQQAPIDNEVLEQRVRAQLGHVVTHPGALEVRANEGRVTVGGPVLVGERERIRTRLNKTRGVQEVNLTITEYANTEGIPGLQGESREQRNERQRLAL